MKHELHEALDELATAWDARVPAMSERAAPGLTEDEARDALESMGLRPAEGVIAWFGWRNGTLPGQYLPMTTVWPLVSLSQALETTAIMRNVQRQDDVMDVPGLEIWNDHLLSLTSEDGDHLIVDTREDWGPVWWGPRDGAYDERVLQAPNLVELVRGWIREFHDRQMLWDGFWLPKY